MLGRKHPEIATALNNLARLLVERRDYRAALPLLQRAVTIQLAQRGDGGADLAFLCTNVGISLRGVGRTEEARRYLKHGLAVATARKHRNQAPVLGELAELACATGNPDRGQALVAEARPIMAAAYPNDPWRSAWLDAVSARCLVSSGKGKEAPRLRASAAPAILSRWPKDSHFGAILNP